MKKSIAILKGDGIGPEIVDQTIKVLDAIADRYCHQFNYQEALIGGVSIDEKGVPLPEETIATCKSADAILLGAIGDPKFDNDPNATVRPEQGLLKIRKELGLFANVRPVKIYTSLESLSPLKKERLEGVDMVIYRELTGGIYFGKKTKNADSASDLCYYHKDEIERITKLAFDEATRRKFKLCLVDKANVLESSRLWRKVVQGMAAHYPEVEVSYLFVDNAAMQLILNPSQFDVILTSNMFGDILSDAASVLGGSIGLLPSASFGKTHKLYEPVHGSYPQAKGKNIANPMATILSAAMMLRDFGMEKEATAIEEAVEDCINLGITTEDINNDAANSCTEVAMALCNIIEGQSLHSTIRNL